MLDLYQHIWRGSFPHIALDAETPRDLFYNAYIQAYIQRDLLVVILANIGATTDIWRL